MTRVRVRADAPRPWDPAATQGVAAHVGARGRRGTRNTEATKPAASNHRTVRRVVQRSSGPSEPTVSLFRQIPRVAMTWALVAGASSTPVLRRWPATATLSLRRHRRIEASVQDQTARFARNVVWPKGSFAEPQRGEPPTGRRPSPAGFRLRPAAAEPTGGPRLRKPWRARRPAMVAGHPTVPAVRWERPGGRCLYEEVPKACRALAQHESRDRLGGSADFRHPGDRVPRIDARPHGSTKPG